MDINVRIKNSDNPACSFSLPQTILMIEGATYEVESLVKDNQYVLALDLSLLTECNERASAESKQGRKHHQNAESLCKVPD